LAATGRPFSFISDFTSAAMPHPCQSPPWHAFSNGRIASTRLASFTFASRYSEVPSRLHAAASPATHAAADAWFAFDSAGTPVLRGAPHDASAPMRIHGTLGFTMYMMTRSDTERNPPPGAAR